MSRFKRGIIGAATFLFGLFSPFLRAEEFESAEFKSKDGKKLLYRILRPVKIEPGKKYPLVLFLHGAGERGDDNRAQLVHGSKEFLKKEARERFPAFVVFPQCPAEKKWVEVDWSAPHHDQPEKPSETAALVEGLLEDLQKSLPIEAKRLYVTGLSMGGYGTWDMIARHPEKFAAAVPVCGGGDEKSAPKIKGIPIWAFHGSEDQAVPPARSRNMVEALKKAGGNPKYTEYPGVGHDSWNKAYAEPELFPWLFAQKLK